MSVEIGAKFNAKIGGAIRPAPGRRRAKRCGAKSAVVQRINDPGPGAANFKRFFKKLSGPARAAAAWKPHFAPL
jgi:hypothetical protein